MVDYIILAVFSMLLTGVSDFLYKRARIKRAVPELFLAIQAVFFNATVLTFVAFSGSLVVSVVTIFFGVVCAFLGYFSIYLFLKSLGEGSASINVPIYRLGFIITAIMAMVFLHEAATFGKFLAISLAAFSMFALSRSLKTGSMSRRTFLQLIFATVVYALLGFLYKVAITMGSTPTGILVVQGAVFITYAFIAASRKGLIRRSRSVMFHAPICGILLSLAFMALLESLKYGEVGVSFSIVQLSFMVTSILAILVWREEVRMLNFLGIIAALLAVVSFTYF